MWTGSGGGDPCRDTVNQIDGTSRNKGICRVLAMGPVGKHGRGAQGDTMATQRLSDCTIQSGSCSGQVDKTPGSLWTRLWPSFVLHHQVTSSCLSLPDNILWTLRNVHRAETVDMSLDSPCPSPTWDTRALEATCSYPGASTGGSGSSRLATWPYPSMGK
jgi:hypothetical protein